MKRTFLYGAVAAVAAAVVVLTSLAQPSAQQAAVQIDADDIGGVVTSTRGPEAGVWVIAETGDLPTRFAKIVVTDDQGRYLLPDLPQANYSVWVRGYGLVDSQKVTSPRGRTVNLAAVIAPNARAAAEYYPGNFWYSMMRVPEPSEFPGTGANGNGIGEQVRSQADWIRRIKTDSCESCHQLGTKGTREIPATFASAGNSVAQWERRIQSGQAGQQMLGGINQLGRGRALTLFAEWTDRVRNGEVPAAAPPRPQGVERNIVITQWDWADPTAYLHDSISTDKRNPTVNANGLLYGAAELSKDYIPVLDPVRHTASRIPLPVRDPNTPTAAPQTVAAENASAFWGTQAIWDSKANAHNPMMDHRGRLWLTSRVRGQQQPAFCGEGSTHPSARITPVQNAGRHLAMYDPQTQRTTLIDTCFGTHHLFFAEDANHTLWTSGGGPVVGWLNTRMFDETGDEQRSQGWTAIVLDHNGNGRRDAYTEANQPANPMMDRRINAGFYGVMPSPADGSIWGSYLGFPGGLVRIAPGANPPETAIAEVYETPWQNPRATTQGYGPRGMDVDRNGVVWVALASGHFGSFDRRLCKSPLNGPNATGQHCPEGWRMYQTPGPNFQNAREGANADSHYYDWVDQFDTFGLGANTPIVTGNGSDSLLALNPATGQWTTIRVPYPLGFFAKGLDGRIDDPRAGWKGRGLWTTLGSRTPFHTEGGTRNMPQVYHFQLRPNPLAR
jgi:hypothetical protein